MRWEPIIAIQDQSLYKEIIDKTSKSLDAGLHNKEMKIPDIIYGSAGIALFYNYLLIC